MLRILNVSDTWICGQVIILCCIYDEVFAQKCSKTVNYVGKNSVQYIVECQ
jgi:hypothetical protein